MPCSVLITPHLPSITTTTPNALPVSLATRLMAGRTRRALQMLSLAMLVSLLTVMFVRTARLEPSSQTATLMPLDANPASLVKQVALDLLSALQSLALPASLSMEMVALIAPRTLSSPTRIPLLPSASLAH